MKILKATLLFAALPIASAQVDFHKDVAPILREYCAGCHNDENLKGPGFGEVDFKPIATALKEVNYTGVVSVEVFKFEEGPEAIATQSLRYLQETFAPSA